MASQEYNHIYHVSVIIIKVKMVIFYRHQLFDYIYTPSIVITNIFVRKVTFIKIGNVIIWAISQYIMNVATKITAYVINLACEQVLN